MPITRLNQKNFQKYTEHKEHLENKIFLYSDRPPQKNTVSFEGTTYKLENRQEIKVSGNVTDPSRSLNKITLTYEYDRLIATIDAVGFLFVYNGFSSSGSRTIGGVKQLKFYFFQLSI
ncbi:MAG: hypothetical protein ACXAC7_05635 [Candidatus Hodarchaeales archaeon]|jgi:hypothetical protein